MYLCIAQKCSTKLPIFQVVRPILDAIGIKELCRIYAIFHKKDIWFEHIPKTTTNNNNRYIIPINKEKGVIMIAYADSKYAKQWKENETRPKTFLKELTENIHKTFGFIIHDPKYLKAFYWETGTAFWKPSYDSTVLYKQMLQPIHTMPLYVCGENFSQTQGWMEGALESSLDVISCVEKNYEE